MAINTQKVIVGGLGAGVVMNVIDFVSNNYFLKSMNEADMKRLGLSMDALMTGAAVVPFILLDFALGILLVWTYAAIRPRFGPGAKTAMVAGLLFFFIIGDVWGVVCALGVFPWSTFAAGAVVTFVNMTASAYVGAMLYKEEPEAV